jgi:ubiquinone/menaquinone biosynthesis C-methylase UbiE
VTERAHNEVVQSEFAKQARSFEDPKYSFADPRLTRWILSHIPVEPGSLVLDVAGGTGHLGRALAAQAGRVVVVDITEAMLAEGRQQVEAAGVTNVVFERGDAAALAHPDEAFDLVASRFAVHHFAEPARQIGEMVRVCRHGGMIALIDLVALGPDVAADHNRLERLRDPSHTNALTEAELASVVEEAGATIVHRASHDQRLDVERWLRQAETPGDAADRIRAELRAELERGRPTGLRPVLDDERLFLTQRWVILVATRRRPVGAPGISGGRSYGAPGFSG